MVDYWFVQVGFPFQNVEEEYRSKDWTILHQEMLMFQKTADGSPPAMTLQFAKPSTEKDKWEIEPAVLPPVRKFSLQVHC